MTIKTAEQRYIDAVRTAKKALSALEAAEDNWRQLRLHGIEAPCEPSFTAALLIVIIAQAEYEIALSKAQEAADNLDLELL